MIKHRHMQRQRGAYTIFTLFALTMSMGALGVLAVGHAAWEKNRVQSIADMVALTAARQMSDGPNFSEAREIGLQNGLLDADEVVLNCLIDGEPTSDCDNALTSRVSITRSVLPILPFFPNREIAVLAEATNAPTVVGTVTSGLASVDSAQSALLNGLLSSLGGGSVNLSVLQWEGLLGSNVQVDLLQLKTQLGVATMNDLLALNLSALSLLQESLAVGTGAAGEVAQAEGLLGLLSGPLNAVDVTVGDLLAVDLSGQSNTVLVTNFGQLLQVAVLNASKGGGVTVPISSGLLNLDVGVQVLEAPQVFVGRKESYKNPLVQAKTAQVGLDVRVRQPLGINIALISLSALDMRLQLRAAGGLAEVNTMECRYPRANNTLTMTVVPALAQVCIANSSGNLNTSVGSLTCGAPANILNVNLLGLVNAGVTLGAQGSLESDPVQETFEGVAPYTQTVDLSVGDTLGSALENIDLDLNVNLPFVGPLISATVNGLVSVLLNALAPALSPILGVVGDILDNLLSVLGVNLNTVDVNVNSMDCQSVVLTR